MDKITTSGKVTRFLPSHVLGNGGEIAITAGGDGNLWIANDSILERTAGGSFRHYAGQIDDSRGIVTGPDGALWFATQGSTTVLARVSTAGKFRSITPGALPTDGAETLYAGSHGRIWFSEQELGGSFGADPGLVGVRFSNGHVLYRHATQATFSPSALTLGPDHEIWYATAANSLGRIGLTG